MSKTKTEIEAVKLDLKPCPFCGCDTPALSYSRDGPFINCPECLASTNVLVPFGQTIREVVETWNRREEYQS